MYGIALGDDDRTGIHIQKRLAGSGMTDQERSEANNQGGGKVRRLCRSRPSNPDLILLGFDSREKDWRLEIAAWKVGDGRGRKESRAVPN